jgi:hypothetical protein
MPDIYEVPILFTGPSSPMISRLFFHVSGGTAQQAASAVATWMATMDDYMNTAYGWSTDNEIRTLDAADGSLTGVIPVTVSSGGGGSSGEPLDLLQTQVTWNTGAIIGGRLVKGRTFLPGVDESRNDSTGRPINTMETQVNTACAALVANATSELVVWHRPKWNEDRTVLESGGDTRVVTSGALNLKWAYLTSRRR